MFIKKLNIETINLISAGEVIEGPSDVLKELIENAIDSKADIISVEIKSSGTDLIKVKDNGSGILKDDLKICTNRYTTSKLSTINDLYYLDTFGFRGEALSSINSISKLKIISSTNNDGNGYILENNKIKEYNTTKGTIIIVESLFYNLPVRKKFLKSKSIEFSKLYDIFLAFSVLNPNIRFSFISEKKKVIFPKTTQENRYIQIFGKDINRNTFSIDINNELFSVTGILINPSKQFIFHNNFLFINNRYVYYPKLSKVIKDSYKDYLMIQQKPFFVLFFKINQKTLDINIHPKKRFIKIQNEILFLSELKRELISFLDRHLGKDASSNFIQYNNLSNFRSSSNLKDKTQSLKNNYSLSDNLSNTSYKSNLQNHFYVKEYKDKENLVIFNHEIIKIMGQINNTYIVCETKDGFILIDQHATAERISLEKNRFKLANSFDKQNLISPKKLDFLSESQKAFLDSNKKKISDLGFEFQKLDNEYILNTIPNFLGKYFDYNIFISLLSDMKNNPNDKIDKIKDNIIKLKSCKSSLKSNTELSLNQQYELIKELSLCKDKGICAHGRPTILYISIKDLEKMFKRIV